MRYEALARKWRPKSFEEVVGQNETVTALINALDSDRLHHAYLFSGTRGVGKTTLARIFAKSLNCDSGISSIPCGDCSSCTDIDQGRMVDLLEVDAASRTKVEETRELLDNVQYVPTRSRFKIYLIDEIHMFSKHSFNALLKTLEEPPPHVKFLLATTDPQKLPLTVLSRCLQFSLRKVGAGIIGDQLEKILVAEQVTFEKEAIQLISRAADGSVRDALSLLDQAIVHSSGNLRFDDTNKMLGLAEGEVVLQLLDSVVENRGRELLNLSRNLGIQNLNFGLILKQMLDFLRRIALLQVIAEYEDNLESSEEVAILSKKMNAEDCQLYYEIVLQGLKNLDVSSDLESGFEMVLLRLLAFRPVDSSPGKPIQERLDNAKLKPKENGSRNASKIVDDEFASEAGTNQTDFSNSPYDSISKWEAVVRGLDITGLPKELARNSSLSSTEQNVFHLEVSREFSNLVESRYIKAVGESLSRQLGKEIRLDVSVSNDNNLITPATRESKEAKEKELQVKEELENNPNIEKLRSVFDANLDGFYLEK